MTKLYSQGNEQPFIVDHLSGLVGTFLDIGAYDGVQFSNTYRLLELGWSGVLVEASPSIFALLTAKMAQFAERARCIQLGILPNISGRLHRKLKTMHECSGDAVSTFVDSHKEKWESPTLKFNTVEVPCLSLTELLEEVGYNFDMVNIDTEGCSAKLFFDLPIPMFTRLKVICVEHDSEIDNILKRATAHGFREAHRNGENLVLVR